MLLTIVLVLVGLAATCYLIEAMNRLGQRVARINAEIKAEETVEVPVRLSITDPSAAKLP